MALKVVIDAGHGRYTPGKRSPAGEREWTFNNIVALACIAELKKYQNVEIMRVDDSSGNTDVSLASRTAKANSWKGSIYVSIHHNANLGRWGTWTGTETFVYSSTVATDGSMKLAKQVHPRIVAAMGLRDRGIKKANFHVLRETRMPAILTEGGYMDSSIDILKMRNKSVMQAQGRAIAQGIVAYGGLKLKAGSTAPKPVVNPKNLYRVRKTWGDAGSQKGAFADLDGAIEVAKKEGLNVYDAKGKQVYPTEVAKPATPDDNLYRVRRTFLDVDSQIGAFAELDGAKTLADANLTHNVYDGKGTLVYNPRKAKAEREAAEEARKEAEAKAKAEAEAKAAEQALEDARKKAEEIAKESNLAILDVAILMNSARDFDAAYKIHLATGYPMFSREAMYGRMIASHAIVVGGTEDGLVGENARRVTMVSGKTADETAKAVDDFIAGL